MNENKKRKVGLILSCCCLLLGVALTFISVGLLYFPNIWLAYVAIIVLTSSIVLGVPTSLILKEIDEEKHKGEKNELTKV